MNIDWSPVTTALIALIATVISVYIPMFVKLIYETQKAKLEKVMAFKDANQEVVDGIVKVVQQTLNLATNSEKYHEALARASAALKLPDETLHDMIELAIANFKLSWGEEWEKLGGSEETPPVV